MTHGVFSLQVCVCVCVSVLTRVRVSGFYVYTGRWLHAGVHIKKDEGEKEGEIEQWQRRETKWQNWCGGSKKQVQSETPPSDGGGRRGEIQGRWNVQYVYRSGGSFTSRLSSDLQPGPPVLPHCAPREVLGHGQLKHWQTSCLDTLSSRLDRSRGSRQGVQRRWSLCLFVFFYKLIFTSCKQWHTSSKWKKKMSLVINVSVGSSVETSSPIYISSTFILYFPRLLLFLVSSLVLQNYTLLKHFLCNLSVTSDNNE